MSTLPPAIRLILINRAPDIECVCVGVWNGLAISYSLECVNRDAGQILELSDWYEELIKIESIEPFVSIVRVSVKYTYL